MDCFVASAPRNDAVGALIRFRNRRPHSRGAMRPSFASIAALKNERAQGKPDARCTRGLVCNEVVEGAHEHTGPAETSDFPCAAVYGLYALSSVSHALLPPSPACLNANLTPALGVSGPHDFARPLQAPSSEAPSPSTASPPRAGTLRNAPLSGTGWELIYPDLYFCKTEIFLIRGLDTISEKPK